MPILSRSTLSKAFAASSLLVLVNSSYAYGMTDENKKEETTKKTTVIAESQKQVEETTVEKSLDKARTSSTEINQIESVPYPEECDEGIDFSIGNNSRDGFFLGLSAISSTGDDFSFTDANDDGATFDTDIAYRVQLASLFIESPGLSSRRIHGMYSLPAWGLNFYDNEDWSFDLFYQYSTRGSKGLEGIQPRNENERAGLRVSGYLENSQLQFIYTPISRNKKGSDGIEASLSYGYNGQIRNWTYYVNVGLQYRSKEVRPHSEYGYPDLPVETDSSKSAGLSYNARVGLEYPLTTDWVFASYVAYHALSDRNIGYRQDYIDDNVEDGYRAGLLLSYVF